MSNNEASDDKTAAKQESPAGSQTENNDTNSSTPSESSAPPEHALPAIFSDDATGSEPVGASSQDEEGIESDEPAEILPPTSATIRSGSTGSRPIPVMIALAADAIWIHETWSIRRLPLIDVIQIELRERRETIVIATGKDETIELRFAAPGLAKQWADEALARKNSIPPEPAARAESLPPKGVSLIRGKPKVPYEVLGPVEFTDQSDKRAGWGLRLRAGMMGGDAVIQVFSQTIPGLGASGRQSKGLAISVPNDDARKQLRLCWYGEELNGLVKRCLIGVALLAVMLFVTILVRSNKPSPHGLDVPTNETQSEMWESTGLALAIVFTWPLVTLGMLRILQWPQLINIAGLVVLVATTVRGLTIVAAHFLAVAVTGSSWAKSKFWSFFDPFDWCFIVFGLFMLFRARSLAHQSRQILPLELQVASTSRKALSRTMKLVTWAYLLAIVGWIGFYRYEGSKYLLQPGIDVTRERDGFNAINEGVAFLRAGDLTSAERSFQKALKIWEELTDRSPVPIHYRVNLAITLTDLGYIRRVRGAPADAAPYYVRAIKIADQLSGDPQIDEDFKDHIADARKYLADLQRVPASDLFEKDKTAIKKYEEGQIKASKGDPAAEQLYLECISLWEEILPNVSERFLETAVVRLAEVHLLLAEFQMKLRKRTEAEASLRKSISYSERAVKLEPDRALTRHNLEIAQRHLVTLRGEAHQDAIAKLEDSHQFAEAAALHREGLAEAEAVVRSGKEPELAKLVLAYRLNQFALFLGHCPHPSIVDTKKAVEYARRAVELLPDENNYLYNLGVVQYRNGNWKDSLASLEKLRMKEGSYDGAGLLMVAMNRYRLGQRQEAQSGLRQASEWMEKRKKDAEGDAALRFQYELARPALEALRQEAEKLIEGKNAIID